MTQAETLQRTPLYDIHVAAGAKIVPFAGWEMPVHYAGVREEHVAVRTAAGIFDVSHMGQVKTSGPGALAFLQRILSNDVERIAVGGAQYSLLCKEDGGVLDDLFSYRLGPDTYLTVTNASNHGRDLARFRQQAAAFEGVTVEDQADQHAMIAVQGPLAREIVQAVADTPLPRRMTAGSTRMAGHHALVCGTGYTGEDGVEILCAPEVAAAIWEQLVRRGATPAGLAARDTLRLEACFPLYGNDLTEERGPIEAGLGWACKEETGFIGSEAVARARAGGPQEKLVAFTIPGKGIARQGNEIIGGGVVTSGTMSPSLGIGIGMAYVPADRAGVGTPLEIDVRGRTRDAVVAARPLHARPSA